MADDDAAAAPPTTSAPVVPIVTSSSATPPPAKRAKTMDSAEPEITAATSPASASASASASALAFASAAATAASPASAAASTPAAAPAAAAPPSSTALLIQKLSSDARLPTRGSAFAAGYDLYAARPITIPHQGKALVETDLAIAVPPGTYGRIAPRSGLAAKHFIDTGAGVIDADYRGHVRVLLFNHDPVNDFDIAAGDRVAQLVLERIVTPDVVEVAQLEASVRGAGGFGSTGGFGAATAAAPAAVPDVNY